MTSPLLPNSSYVLKTGTFDGSQVFEQLPLGAKVIGTDANGNPIDGSDNLQTDLNYVANASLVYEGTQFQDIKYYQEPAIGSPFRIPVGTPFYYYQYGSHDQIDLLDPPLVITYDSNGYITSPVNVGTGDSLIFDESRNRIDQKVIHTEIYFSHADPLVRCDEPIKDSLGNPTSPDWNDDSLDTDPNQLTNEIYDYNGVRVGRREVSLLNEDAIASVNVEFNIDDTWEEGDIKQFYFRSLMMPIKMNSSVYYGINADLKKVQGRVILTVETEEGIGFIYLHSYADNHVIEDESSIVRTDRAYTIRVDLRRTNDTLVLVSCEYRIPFYYEDTINSIYKQGEFTFRTCNYKTLAGTESGVASSSKIFYPSTKKAYNKVTINIGSDWSPSLVGSSNCWAYYNLAKLDESGDSEVHLCIKTFTNITDATDLPQ